MIKKITKTVLFLVSMFLLFSCNDTKEKGQNKKKTELSQKVVEKAYEKYLAGDIPGLMELMSDDIIWTMSGPQDITPFAGVYNGKDGFMDFVTKLSTEVTTTAFDIHYHVADGNRVDTHLLEGGTSTKTGKSFNSEIVHAWEVNDDGKITSFYSHNHTYNVASIYDKDLTYDGTIVDPVTDDGIKGKDGEAIVNEVYKRYLAGNIDGLLELMADDVKWTMAGATGVTPYAGTYTGKDGVKAFITNYLAATTPTALEIHYNVAQGDRVATHFMESGTSKATGKSFSTEIVHSWEVNPEGKVSKLYSYHDTYNVAQAYITD